MKKNVSSLKLVFDSGQGIFVHLNGNSSVGNVLLEDFSMKIENVNNKVESINTVNELLIVLRPSFNRMFNPQEDLTIFDAFIKAAISHIEINYDNDETETYYLYRDAGQVIEKVYYYNSSLVIINSKSNRNKEYHDLIIKTEG